MPGNFLYLYQHLPSYINPDLSLGFFSVSWYSMMYLVAFVIVYFLLSYRIKKKEISGINAHHLLNFLVYVFVGLLIGARLGYVLFYNLPYYIKFPLAVISPFDPATGQFIGIYGMSYHGGLIGVIISAVIFCHKHKINFWSLANFVAPAVPAGYFFGRIGNFINGELYGRVTLAWWGMYFPGSVGTGPADLAGRRDLSVQDMVPQLRYPSQLMEAFLEGLILFLILWPLRNNPWFKDKMVAFYLIGYAIFRILVEFFRAPDEQIGLIAGYFTLGQILCLLMLIFGIGLLWKKTKKLV